MQNLEAIEDSKSAKVAKRNHIKSLIRRVFRGEEPSDELYCYVILQFLQAKFASYSDQEFAKQCLRRKAEEISQMKKLLRGEVVDESKFSVFNKVDKEELKRREPVIDESTVALVKPSGFVLVDFPNTYEQALMLERMMTGFMPKDHVVLTENEVKKEELHYLVVSSEKP